MIISLHMLVDGLAHLFYLDMSRGYEGLIGQGLGILLFIRPKQCLHFFEFSESQEHRKFIQDIKCSNDYDPNLIQR